MPSIRNLTADFIRFKACVWAVQKQKNNHLIFFCKVVAFCFSTDITGGTASRKTTVVERLEKEFPRGGENKIAIEMLMEHIKPFL